VPSAAVAPVAGGTGPLHARSILADSVTSATGFVGAPAAGTFSTTSPREPRTTEAGIWHSSVPQTACAAIGACDITSARRAVSSPPLPVPCMTAPQFATLPQPPALSATPRAAPQVVGSGPIAAAAAARRALNAALPMQTAQERAANAITAALAMQQGTVGTPLVHKGASAFAQGAMSGRLATTGGLSCSPPPSGSPPPASGASLAASSPTVVDELMRARPQVLAHTPLQGAAAQQPRGRQPQSAAGVVRSATPQQRGEASAAPVLPSSRSALAPREPVTMVGSR